MAKRQQKIQISIGIMKNYTAINESIVTLEPYKGFDEATYYTMGIFNEFCKTRDLKRVTIFGYYKSKYHWNNTQAQEMYDKAPDGWTDGLGIYRVYDWGRGENKIIKDIERDWHEPHLDHIIPRSKGGSNDPFNFQVLPRKLNIILSNLTDEEAPALLPLLLAQFPGLEIN